MSRQKIHKFPIPYHDINFYVTIYDILPMSMSHSTIFYYEKCYLNDVRLVEVLNDRLLRTNEIMSSDRHYISQFMLPLLQEVKDAL